MCLIIYLHFQPPICHYQTRGSQRSNQQVNLSKAEIEDITVPGYWLESSHINAAINLIKHQFPNIGGLNDTTLGWDLEFPAAPSENGYK